MKKFLIVLTIAFTLLSSFSLIAFAEGSDTASQQNTSNFFDEAYSFISENADKILSALAFTASLILAFAYRRGLLPLLKGGLGTLSSTVDSLKADTEAAEGAAREILNTAAERLDCVGALISELTEKLSKLEEDLTITKEEEKRASDLRLIMGTQIELLHDIFMSSSLPYYRKEEVGEKIAEMKRALSSSEEE